MFPITISNPATLKNVLRIAFEVTYIDLSKYQMDNIKSMINELPDSFESTNVLFSGDQIVDLYMCIRFFRQSYTYKLLREDLHHAMYDLESKIVNKNVAL
jgi:hypothetical protein